MKPALQNISSNHHRPAGGPSPAKGKKMVQRRLTDTEEVELEYLNLAVKTAIDTRRNWLDSKMVECSRLKVGDEIYNLETGDCLGKITSLYRYWANRDEGVRDTSVCCNYEYCVAPQCFDNTSRQPGLVFGSRDDAYSYALLKADLLK